MLARSRSDRGAMTVLIVAHRLSTVRNADKIFLIEEGQVVEEGHHNQLIENVGGAYSALVRRQMEAQQKLEEGDEQLATKPKGAAESSSLIAGY